jgi:hypothetical protein
MSSKKPLPKRKPRPQPPVVINLPDVTVHPELKSPLAIMLGRKTVYVFKEATEISDPRVAQKLVDIANSDERFDAIESNVRVKFVTRLHLAQFRMELDTLTDRHKAAVNTLLVQALQEVCRW